MSLRSVVVVLGEYTRPSDRVVVGVVEDDAGPSSDAYQPAYA